MIIPELEGVTLTKGHGAGNDFVMVPDLAGQRAISEQTVAAICDRHLGVGADGLIRVVRTVHVPEMADVAAAHPEAEWFMDYRNADGSVAQMCGNGVRVFVHYLRIQGLIDLVSGEEVAVATRGGVRTVRFNDPDYTVDMGEYGLPFGPGGADTTVDIPGVGIRPALSVTMPNPHTVVLLQNLAELDAADLHHAPQYDPVPKDGTNLELAVPGEVSAMRVLERGVGETLACGTGTCAVALAVLLARGDRAGRVEIDARGGHLSVLIEGGRAFLTGPAILVAEVNVLGIAGH